MQSERFQANASGEINAGFSGIGFAICPAVANETVFQLDYLWTSGGRPGSLPVRVTTSQDKDLYVGNSGPHLFAERFSNLKLTGLRPRDWYQVTTFEKGEGIGPAPALRRVFTVFRRFGVTGIVTAPDMSAGNATNIEVGPNDLEFVFQGSTSDPNPTSSTAFEIWVGDSSDPDTSVAYLWDSFSVDTVLAKSSQFMFSRRIPGPRFQLQAIQGDNAALVAPVTFGVWSEVG